MESKEALASEVAEKYDQVIALRREIQELEDKCHHLSMQTQFKEDIIKDLRKELKQVSQKVFVAFFKIVFFWNSQFSINCSFLVINNQL